MHSHNHVEVSGLPTRITNQTAFAEDKQMANLEALAKIINPMAFGLPGNVIDQEQARGFARAIVRNAANFPVPLLVLVF